MRELESTELPRPTQHTLKGHRDPEGAPPVPTPDKTQRPQPDACPRAPLPSAREHSSRGTTRAALGRPPPPVPSSLALPDVWRGRGEVAKSSPLHGPACARHFPISARCQPRRPGEGAPPVHSRVSGAPPAPSPPPRPPRAASSHSVSDARTAGEEGGSTQLRPQHLRARSRALPCPSPPGSGRPPGKGRG